MDARENAVRYKLNPAFANENAPELAAEWLEKARPASKVLSRLFGKNSAAELLKPKR
jgi:hypothetical protein